MTTQPGRSGRTKHQPANRLERPSVHDQVDILADRHMRVPGSGLNQVQVGAAREIAWISSEISKAGNYASAKLDAPRSAGYREFTLSGRADRLRVKVYLPWLQHLMTLDPIMLDICVAIAIRNLSRDAIARKHKMRRERALALLQQGLALYLDIRSKNVGDLSAMAA